MSIDSPEASAQIYCVSIFNNMEGFYTQTGVILKHQEQCKETFWKCYIILLHHPNFIEVTMTAECLILKTFRICLCLLWIQTHLYS